MAPWCRRLALGVALSLSWLQRARTHVQVLAALLSKSSRKRKREYTKDMCKLCFLKAEEAKTNRPRQALKAYQQQRRTSGTTESSRGMHDVPSDANKKGEIKEVDGKGVGCTRAGGVRIDCCQGA